AGSAQGAPGGMGDAAVAGWGLEATVASMMDNSYLIEEAYNQEAGVVQHIVNGLHGVNRYGRPDERSWDVSFTQEWPVVSQRHQLSYTIPYQFRDVGGVAVDGLGDVWLHYRVQAYLNPRTGMALAPRASVSLPTGDADRGLGEDTVGFQANVPWSAVLGDRVAAHINAGLTYYPEGGSAAPSDRLHFHAGASGIYAVSRSVHLMLEGVGTWTESAGGGGREFAAVLAPGARFCVELGRERQLVLGASAPFGLNGAAVDYGAFCYLSFEHRLWRERL
ncbi:MAG: hypothetical protein FJ387_12320, partial [Verrucomicrobia bacterium]|nr:hypothetical protein [Verrucomicrobiota bacterium]